MSPEPIVSHAIRHRWVREAKRACGYQDEIERCSGKMLAVSSPVVPLWCLLLHTTYRTRCTRRNLTLIKHWRMAAGCLFSALRQRNAMVPRTEQEKTRVSEWPLGLVLLPTGMPMNNFCNLESQKVERSFGVACLCRVPH